MTRRYYVLDKQRQSRCFGTRYMVRCASVHLCPPSLSTASTFSVRAYVFKNLGRGLTPTSPSRAKLLAFTLMGSGARRL